MQAFAAWAMFSANNAMALTRKVAGVILHAEWTTYAFVASLACAVAAALALMASNWR